MSETKTPWTPAPWVAVECDAEPGDELYEIFDGDMEGLICEGIAGRANANLISSAPAMAEALELAKKALIEIRRCSSAAIDEARIKPDQALSDAHGFVQYALNDIDDCLALARGEPS